MKSLRVAINIAAFQGAWFACVLSAAAGRMAIGLAAASAVVLWHLYCAEQPRRELWLLAIAILCGTAFETLLVASGWVRMQPALLIGTITPLWMVALWAAFATTLNVSLRTLRPRYLLSAVGGAVGAPLSYYAGARMGALQWVHELPALLAIALGWSALTPLLMKSAQRFDGFSAA